MKLIVKLLILINLRRPYRDAAKATSLASFMEFSGLKLILYRGIRRGDDPTIDPIGKHWSAVRKQAFPYGGKGPQEYYYMYKAVVNLWDVDWSETNAKTLDTFSYERETVLKPGHRIKVLSVRKIYKVSPERRPEGWHFPEVFDETEVNRFLTV